MCIRQTEDSCKSAFFNQRVNPIAPLEVFRKSVLNILKKMKFLLLLGENLHFILIGWILALSRPFVVPNFRELAGPMPPR